MTFLVVNNGNVRSLDQIDYFNQDDILYICDTFDLTDLEKIIKTKGMPFNCVSDLYSSYTSTDIKIHCIPICTAELSIDLLSTVNFLTPPSFNTHYCFNFLINKKQINRYLLIKLIEWFNLHSMCKYTWSGAGRTFELSNLVKEFELMKNLQQDDSLKGFLLSPIKINANWIEFNNTVAANDCDSSVLHSGTCADTWQAGINSIVSNSGISLISESLTFQTGAVFTEKTHYSVLGLTFPIWIGGFNQAQTWKEMGFDIFEDIIDHSYQNYSTLIERCYYAIYNNLNLLQNLDQLSYLRNKNIDRLLANRKMLLSSHLQDHCIKEIENSPIILKEIWRPFAKNLWKFNWF